MGIESDLLVITKFVEATKSAFTLAEIPRLHWEVKMMLDQDYNRLGQSL